MVQTFKITEYYKLGRGNFDRDLNNIIFLTNEIITHNPLVAQDSEYYKKLYDTFIAKYQEKKEKKKQSNLRQKEKKKRTSMEYQLIDEIANTTDKSEEEDEEKWRWKWNAKKN